MRLSAGHRLDPLGELTALPSPRPPVAALGREGFKEERGSSRARRKGAEGRERKGRGGRKKRGNGRRGWEGSSGEGKEGGKGR